MPRSVGLPKTGGRKKGTPNQKTLNLQETLSENGINVPEEIVRLLPSLTKDRRVEVLLELMNYLYPKRKAIEQEHMISTQDHFLKKYENMTDEELDRILRGYADSVA